MGFFGWVSNKFSVVLHNVLCQRLSAVLHIVLRSSQDGGERGNNGVDRPARLYVF